MPVSLGSGAQEKKKHSCASEQRHKEAYLQGPKAIRSNANGPWKQPATDVGQSKHDGSNSRGFKLPG